MHDSLDPMIYQKHDEKSSRVTDLYSYKGDTMNAQDVNPEELKFALIKDPKKRADMQVMEFKEKNKSDQKMYAQLIDVLHKQINIAFKDDSELDKEVKNDYRIGYNFDIDANNKKIEELKEDITKIESFKKTFQKIFKDDEYFSYEKFDEFKESKSNLLSKDYMNSIYTFRDGKDGYSRIMNQFENTTERVKNRIENNKSQIRLYNKNLKKLKDSREACQKYLASKGIKTKADAELKIQDYVALMDKAKFNIDKAEEMRNQFYAEAVAYNKANEKNLLSVNELVNQNVSSIMNDLHPMDDEWKAKIKAENEARFGKKDVKKSWCYFDKNGNLWFRKSFFV